MCVFSSHLSINAWCRRNIGSLADAGTDDIEPFMKMCSALCIVLWPDTAIPVSGLAKPTHTHTHPHTIYSPCKDMGAMLHLDPNRCYATPKANFNFGTQKETFLSLVNVKTQLFLSFWGYLVHKKFARRLAMCWGRNLNKRVLLTCD